MGILSIDPAKTSTEINVDWEAIDVKLVKSVSHDSSCLLVFVVAASASMMLTLVVTVAYFPFKTEAVVPLVTDVTADDVTGFIFVVCAVAFFVDPVKSAKSTNVPVTASTEAWIAALCTS